MKTKLLIEHIIFYAVCIFFILAIITDFFGAFAPKKPSTEEIIDNTCQLLIYPEVKEEQEFIELDVVEPEEPQKPKLKNLGEFVLTAYCSCEKCCGKWALNRPLDENGEQIVYGASGARLIEGISVAVDPDVIPYGTELYIDGNLYIAHDCGGAVKGNHLDVYFATHEEAWNFGKQTAEVFILEGE